MSTSTDDNQKLHNILSKSFPNGVFELSNSTTLESPDGIVYGVFVPETDGTFATGTKVDIGNIATFTKGIPIYATFTKVIIGSGQAGKLYKK